MKALRLAALASLMVWMSGAVLAQGGPASGKGPGSANGPGPSASAPGMGMGGMAAGRGRMGRSGADYTPGWALMNPSERSEHQQRMRSMKTYEECSTYMAQHREQMATRAKEQGGKELRSPRRDACGGLKP